MAELGIELPALREKAGNYIGWYRSDDLLFLAGQGADGWVGRVGDDLSVEEGKAAARDCMLNLLAQTKDALGDLDRVVGFAKVLGFVACARGFRQTPQVLDGASDLLIDIWGDAGRHPRSAIGVNALPLGFAVEIEMVVKVR